MGYFLKVISMIIWKAKEIAENRLKENSLRLQDFRAWNGNDLIYDFYRIRSADTLAFSDIGKERIKQYRTLVKEKDSNQENEYLKELKLFFEIFSKLMKGANHQALELEP